LLSRPLLALALLFGLAPLPILALALLPLGSRRLLAPLLLALDRSHVDDRALNRRHGCGLARPRGEIDAQR
jgi:hypothetical protein